MILDAGNRASDGRLGDHTRYVACCQPFTIVASYLASLSLDLLLRLTPHARRATILGFRARLRINPVAPYNALNYGLGLSSCTFRAYLQVMLGGAVVHVLVEFHRVRERGVSSWRLTQGKGFPLQKRLVSFSLSTDNTFLVLRRRRSVCVVWLNAVALVPSSLSSVLVFLSLLQHALHTLVSRLIWNGTFL